LKNSDLRATSTGNRKNISIIRTNRIIYYQ